MTSKQSARGRVMAGSGAEPEVAKANADPLCNVACVAGMWLIEEPCHECVDMVTLEVVYAEDHCG